MTNRNQTVQAKNAFLWLLYILATGWLAISLAWSVYARFDYGYGFWYDQLAIGAHIQRYVPKHPDKADFAQLPKTQHVAAFRQISKAVHGRGADLASLRYQVNGVGRPLLDQAEVLHLQDVARLLRLAGWATWPVLVLWVVLAWYLGRQPLPSWRFRAGISAGLVVVGAVLLAVLGAKQIFYTLHVWLFPPEHQWFFYWELSLMSAMMKAPDLFGGIAVVLALLAMPAGWVLYRLGLVAGVRLRGDS